MDPNTRPDFIAKTEDRSRPMYYNKLPDGLRVQQLYPKEDPTCKKQCFCVNVAEKIMCINCRNTIPDNNWKDVQSANVDYKSIDSNNVLQDSSLYNYAYHPHHKKTSDVNKSYFIQKNNPSYLDEHMIANKNIGSTHFDKPNKTSLITSNNHSLETSVHYEQLPQRLRGSDNYYKDRCSYEEEYTLKDESVRNSKMGYIPLASTAGSIYNINNQNTLQIESSRTSIVDQHVINPSNVLSTTDQQPSPNYARKCPQIFSNVEYSSCHSNLYVSPPQFSSEKFTNNNTQQKIFRESSLPDYRAYTSTSSQMQLIPENIKNRDSTILTTTPIIAYGGQSNYTTNEQSSSQGAQHIAYSSNNARNTNCYTPHNPKVGTPEISPIIVKQTHGHYQYSKSPVLSNMSIVNSQPNVQLTADACVKKEDNRFDIHESGHRSMYNNPYNTTGKASVCYSEQTSPCATKTSTLCEESAHSYLKYNKVTSDVFSTNKPHTINVNTPQQNNSSAYLPPSYFYENRNLRYENNAHNLSSPAVAATASSPLQTTSQNQTHHNMYAKQQHHTEHFEQYHHQQQTELTNKKNDIPNTHNTAAFDGNEHQSSKIRIHNINKMQQITANQTSPTTQIPHSTKKSQATKPNYRELINHVYAMRNSTSEEELNLQIIKKTLNMDPQILRSPVPPVPVSITAPMETLQYSPTVQYTKEVPSRAEVISGISHVPVNLVRSSNRLDLPTTHVACIENTTKVQNLLHDIKQEEKVNIVSPLDLSMRTVKTKADSTEYNSKGCIKLQQIGSSDCKYVLPRVDFTPNFALHTNDVTPLTNHVRGHDVNVKNTISKVHYETAIPSYNNEYQTNKLNLKLYPNSSTSVEKVVHYKTESEASNQELQRIAKESSVIVPPTIEIKSKTTNIISNSQVFQARPSVLEANPYANQGKVKQKESVHKDVQPLDQLPIDKSIMQISKTKCENAIQITSDEMKTKNTTQSAYSLACERNPNFLGRKRHLHEYTIAKYSEPILKQARYEGSECKSSNLVEIGKECNVEKEDTKIMYEKSIEPISDQNLPHVESYNANVVICKKEPGTEISTQSAVLVKPETSTLTAARIRTKAELKGFTFNSLPPEPSPKEIKIEEEPLSPCHNNLPKSIPYPNNEFSDDIVLDFNWRNTCNNFVEQLENSSRKQNNKKKCVCLSRREEQCDGDRAATSMLSKSNTVFSPNLLNHSSEDSQNCSIRVEESLTVRACVKQCSKIFEGNESAMTIKSISQDTMYIPSTIQKKISKMDREKMRLQQEKRFAARLQKDSSSESENEIKIRLTERLKKPLKKGKSRILTCERKHFSDCGSDSSSDCEKNELIIKSINKKHCKEIRPNDRLNGNVSHDVIVQSVLNGKDVGNKSLNIVNNRSDISLEDESTEYSEKEDLVRKKDGPRIMQEHHINKKVQYASNSNKDNNVFSKQISKPKIVGLNTMTRSKRKRELELQLANSKVLRNEKIIRNSTTKIKRKYVRKFGNNQTSVSKDNSMKDNEDFMSTRLRSKSERKSDIMTQNKIEINSSNIKKTFSKKKSDCVGNKEHQTDLFLEVYRYKRALKVPPSLITIKHPSNQRISSSLPDLEKSMEEQSTSSKKQSYHQTKLSKTQDSTSINESSKLSTFQELDEPKSIIDVLHSRVIKSKARLKVKSKANTSNSSINTHSETSQTTESNSIGELLPTPKKVDVDNTNDGKKRHFSIFDTKVLQSKTRTESKLQQKKEIIREIFVGDDRPASAPPEMIQMTSDGIEKMTYEQKYEQFLQQMNIGINEEKLRKFGRATTTVIPCSVIKTEQLTTNIKQEEDIESVGAFDADDKVECYHTPTISANTNCFRRRRSGKYLRRKGSSGFDYIRKKKKPTQIPGRNNPLSHAGVKMERIEAYDCGKIKTESDVCREIQKWVLNKGVGQSTMHKAAKLGYIDVIVYCLDRMGLNPDQKDNAGYTPLHEACSSGRLEIARILLQYGANHSEAAHSGIRPLHEASENDHVEIVRMLLSYGADPLLATYSGQTPLMLASSSSVKDIITNHLRDVQDVDGERKPWVFYGPWDIFDQSKSGYNIFGGVPINPCDMSIVLQKINSDSTLRSISGNCKIVGDNGHEFDSIPMCNKMNSKTLSDYDESTKYLIENSDTDGEIFEFEEADVLLPPLYLLNDEGTDKWVLLSDLCNLLKVKSKDTLLNKIYPSSSISSAQKSLTRELKMSDFLEKATCLQLLCAGEKINICASKVVLIKYNDNVRNLLGVKTIFMKF